MNLFFTSLLIFSFSSQANEKWVTCSKDTDCIKVRSVCDRRTAINKKYKLDQEKITLEAELLIQCVPPNKEEMENYNKLKARCIDLKCKLAD